MAKISEGMQGFMNDFLEAKRSFYGWDDETFNKKADNFRGNVKKVKFVPKAQGGNVKGLYQHRRNRVILAMDGARVDSQDTKTIAHELNHAFNHEKGKRMNILKTNGKKIPKDMKKYNMLSEVINEAETQVLFDEINGRPNKDFALYRDAQPSFEMLCVACNQDAATFLRGIEGKDIDGVTEYVAEHSGHTLIETQTYIDAMADELTSFKEKTVADLKKVVDKSQPAYERMVRLNEQFINSSTLDENARATMQDSLVVIKEQEYYKLKMTEERRQLLRPARQKQIWQAEYEEQSRVIRQDKVFDWGVPQSTVKMKTEYTGLDTKKQRGTKQPLELPASPSDYKSSPPAPSMMQCMPDLANVNTPQETVKAYANIDAKITATPTISTPNISGPSIGSGGSAGGGMTR